MRAGLFKLLDLLREELEAREGVEARNAVLLRRGARHLGRDDGLEHRRVRRHGVRQLARGDDVVDQQHADLVAGQGDVFAGLVLQNDAGAVRVRVGADDEVNVILPGQLDGEREAFLVFRVGVLDRREVAVDLHLLGLADNVLVAQAAEDLGHQTVARAVERGVDQLKVVRDLLYAVRVDRNLDDLAEVGLVGLGAQDADHAVLHEFIVIAGAHAGEDIGRGHLLGDHVGLSGRQLRAVLPVDLIAVVLLGVVGRGDIDTRDAAVVADRKGKLGRGAQLIEQQRLDAARREDAGGLPRKFRREVAAVVRDRDAAVHCRLAVRDDQVGKALRRLTDRKAVHAVEADAEHAAQAGGAERQGREKAALDLFLIAFHRLKLRALLIRKSGILQPTLVFRHIIHWYHLILILGPKPLSKLYNICVSMQEVLREFVKTDRVSGKDAQ